MQSYSYNDFRNYLEELKNHLLNKKLLQPTPIYGTLMITTTLLLYVLGLFFIGKIHIAFSILWFYIVIVELGYISHDLIHNQYFKNTKINTFFSFITGNIFIGLSRSWWFKKHNLEHHTFTNSDIHDTDIRDYDEIFTKNTGKSPFFEKHKTILFWIVTTLVYFNLIYLSYKFLIENKKYKELFLNILHLFGLPLVLFLNFGIMGFLYLSIIYIGVGMHLAFVFMVNHIGMEIIDGNKIKEYAWLDLQTRTSRNILGGEIINQIFGGLNKQIEHHLFPQVSRKNILAVGKEVEKFCKQKGIPYHNVTFIQGIKEIYHTLKTGKTL
ncbi:MAG: acyl-CoA desaturase [Candidatus Altimarinota bacterium]